MFLVVEDSPVLVFYYSKILCLNWSVIPKIHISKGLECGPRVYEIPVSQSLTLMCFFGRMAVGGLGVGRGNALKTQDLGLVY